MINYYPTPKVLKLVYEFYFIFVLCIYVGEVICTMWLPLFLFCLCLLLVTGRHRTQLQHSSFVLHYSHIDYVVCVSKLFINTPLTLIYFFKEFLKILHRIYSELKRRKCATWSSTWRQNNNDRVPTPIRKPNWLSLNVHSHFM